MPSVRADRRFVRWKARSKTAVITRCHNQICRRRQVRKGIDAMICDILRLDFSYLENKFRHPVFAPDSGADNAAIKTGVMKLASELTGLAPSDY